MSVVCCQVEVSATSRKLVHRSPANCDASLCDLGTSRMRRPWPALGRSATGGNLNVGMGVRDFVSNKRSGFPQKLSVKLHPNPRLVPSHLKEYYAVDHTYLPSDSNYTTCYFCTYINLFTYTLGSCLQTATLGLGLFVLYGSSLGCHSRVCPCNNNPVSWLIWYWVGVLYQWRCSKSSSSQC
jgi:hypothetical protein